MIRNGARVEELTKLQAVLETKEKISRHKLLDRLLAKTEPLSDMETTLKLKLMSEMLLHLMIWFETRCMCSAD